MAAEMRCELSHCTPASRVALVASRGSVSPVIVDTASTPDTVVDYNWYFNRVLVRSAGRRWPAPCAGATSHRDQHHSGS